VPLPKTAPVPECSEEDREVLKNWAHSRTMEARLVERARIVLGCLEGKPVSAVADSLIGDDSSRQTQEPERFGVRFSDFPRARDNFINFFHTKSGRTEATIHSSHSFQRET